VSSGLIITSPLMSDVQTPTKRRHGDVGAGFLFAARFSCVVAAIVCAPVDALSWMACVSARLGASGVAAADSAAARMTALVASVIAEQLAVAGAPLIVTSELLEPARSDRRKTRSTRPEAARNDSAAVSFWPWRGRARRHANSSKCPRCIPAQSP
jgi:hypothetical protein